MCFLFPALAAAVPAAAAAPKPLVVVVVVLVVEVVVEVVVVVCMLRGVTWAVRPWYAHKVDCCCCCCVLLLHLRLINVTIPTLKDYSVSNKLQRRGLSTTVGPLKTTDLLKPASGCGSSGLQLPPTCRSVG